MKVGIYILLIFVEVCGGTIPYLVSLKSSVSLESFMHYDRKLPKALQVQRLISNSFSFGNFTAFAGTFSKEILDRLKRCPMVAEITPDIIFNAYEIDRQFEAPRHLARLSHQTILDPTRKYSYYFDNNFIGSEVNAYVIDSGVDIHHPELQGRAKHGKDFTNDGPGDATGHGTHVAGIIGSRTYGVAKNVQIIEVKALNNRGTGSLSTILAAIEFSANHRMASGKMGVANLSLGAYKNAILNHAIEKALKTGLVVVAAAGNANIDACFTSPASSGAAITVGAIDDWTDSLTNFSNFGECVDIFSSGLRVESINVRRSAKPLVLSGTSMAAPIVTGLVANLLSEGIPANEVKQTLLDRSTKNRMHLTKIQLEKGTPNRIAYNRVMHPKFRL